MATKKPRLSLSQVSVSLLPIYDEQILGVDLVASLDENLGDRAVFSAWIPVAIFIASIDTSTSPALMPCPGETKTREMTPGIGAPPQFGHPGRHQAP